MSAIESGKYVVVEFLGFNCVDVVPNSWVGRGEKGLFVYWPKSNARARARRCDLPDTSHSTTWKKYKIKQFCSTDDYDRALELTKRAAFTSNLESEGEEETTRVRKKPKKLQSDSDSGDNADTEEQTSLTQRQSKSQATTRSPSPPLSHGELMELVLPRPPRPPTNTVSKKPPQSKRPTQRSAGPTLSNTVQELVTQSYNSSKDDFSGETLLNDSYDHDDEMPMVEVPSSSRASTPGPKRQRNETRDTGFQVNVLMRLTNIEQKMEEQISMMRSVFSSLSLNIEEEEDVFPEPLDSEEELMEFEQRLSNKPYKKKMILYLSSLGGHDMGDSIRRMLRKIGTNKLWSSYSLKGRKNAKKPFQNLNLASVIIKAYLRSNPKASEKDIEDKISGTLKGAPFKKGGVLTVVPADISMVTEARKEDTSADEN